MSGVNERNVSPVWREGQQTVSKHHFNSSVCIQTKCVPIIYDSYIFVKAFFQDSLRHGALFSIPSSCKQYNHLGLKEIKCVPLLASFVSVTN